MILYLIVKIVTVHISLKESSTSGTYTWHLVL